MSELLSVTGEKLQEVAETLKKFGSHLFTYYANNDIAAKLLPAKVLVACSVCGATRLKWRSQVKWRPRHYCSQKCYQSTVRNPNYVEWRQGVRRARKLVAEHFPLEQHHSVHHVDSNQRNNDLSNLWVFASKVDHHKFERGVEVKPLWRGDGL
jgi:hypothetical protein